MTTLWPHQQAAVDFCFPRRAAMLEMGMGTGKTATAIRLIEQWHARRVLIVCPVAVIPAWTKQIGLHASMRWHVLEAGKNVRQSSAGAGRPTLSTDPQSSPIKERVAEIKACLANSTQTGEPLLVVTNYETARDANVVATVLGRFDVVIADESHRMKNHTGRTFRAMKKLAVGAKRRLCLTGTPRPHSPADVWAQYHWLIPECLDSSFYLFRLRYAVMGGWQGKVVEGWRNLEELARRLAPHTYVCGRDVLSLPEAVDITVPVTLCGKTLSVYKLLADGFIAELRGGTVTPSTALVRLLRLQQVTSGYVTIDREHWTDESPVQSELGTEKLDALIGVVEDIPESEPLVVFCRFRHDIERVRAALEAMGGACELSGSVNELEIWQRGEKRALVVQIQSGGVGIDLTRASFCFYFSMGFSLGDYEQSRARVHRPGQRNKVTYYHLVADGSVDEQVYAALEERQQVVGKVLDELLRIQGKEEQHGKN